MLGFLRFSSSEHAGYRFGFNGKEADAEVSGSGNSYDYGFRIYNPRVGRFLSVDPLTKTFPMLTPYQFASNTPIMAIDLDGLEAKIVIRQQQDDGTYGNVTLSRTDYTQTAWQSMQNAYMAIAQDATWGSEKGRDSYLANPVFKKNDGGYRPPVNGILNLTFQNDGSINASYSDRGEKVGGYKAPLTQGEAKDLILTTFKDDMAPDIRESARDISTGAAMLQGAAFTATVSSGGASSEVSVPMAAAAEAVGTTADFVSFFMSLIIDDGQAGHDAMNLALPAMSNRLVNKAVNQTGFKGNTKEAVNAGAKFIESGANEVIDRSTE